MARAIVLLVLLANVVVLKCQEEGVVEEDQVQISNQENPSYSYGYGVSDTRTGDVKTVWEAKEGDTVKGHYSVIEPDGSIRTVEYSAGPNTGFTATVNNDDIHSQMHSSEQNLMEDKALRDYDRYYDFSEDGDAESHPSKERKRKKHPYEALFKDYTLMKRPKYPSDLEPSEYTHSISIKHPHDDDTRPEGESHSHIGFGFDPHCKTKHKKESNKLHTNIGDLDFRKQKHPFIQDSYKDKYENKYDEPSGPDLEKILQMYKYGQYKGSKPDELSMMSTSVKYSYPALPDMPSSDLTYPDDIPPRPKKKYRPNKNPEPYKAEDLDDYILVPKKKLKKPPRLVDPSDFPEEFDEDFGSIDDFEDERHHRPPRGGPKEVVRKIVKKKKPVINILDIFDI